MEITVQHLGIRYTLDVYSDEDGDFFSVAKLEATDAPLEIAELASVLAGDAFEIQRLARAELASARRTNKLDFEEARAA
ncbi:hypothetical protein [Azotobacter beijerinckii]|uniref:Uncharacterized protein n=1 Tax=Azotobacter beijerinckii TaxID=170623 RepID=A0A1I0Z3E6_9GAMM|nr:hypothetical protein [Azotobacter beijerinckii]SFB19857.1 hypothetical protein SAMN04244571_01757 [Azotobacter beijerinckii]